MDRARITDVLLVVPSNMNEWRIDVWVWIGEGLGDIVKATGTGVG
jgi:hypothetical protein